MNPALVAGGVSLLSGVASWLGSRRAAAQQKALKEAMEKQEQMRLDTIKHQTAESERIQKILGDYAQPFYDDSKKLSSGLVGELENHERERLNPDQMNDHPMVKSMSEQLIRRLRPMLMKQGLWGSNAANDMVADSLQNNQLNTYAQLSEIHNKTRDSIANSRATGLAQTQRMPEAFVSATSSLANTNANALAGVETGIHRNMAGFGQSYSNVRGQKYYDTGNIASNTINNSYGVYKKEDQARKMRPYLEKAMGGNGGGLNY